MLKHLKGNVIPDSSIEISIGKSRLKHEKVFKSFLRNIRNKLFTTPLIVISSMRRYPPKVEENLINFFLREVLLE
jgi:hypothetical protein